MSSLNYVKNLLAAETDVSAEYLVKALGVTKPYAYTLLSKGRKELGMRKKNGVWKHKTRLQGVLEVASLEVAEQQPPAVIPVSEPKTDNVNHPPHYKVGGIETIDFIEAKGLNYHLGNVVKYVARADHKGDRIENLMKAQWYLTREIESATR